MNQTSKSQNIPASVGPFVAIGMVLGMVIPIISTIYRFLTGVEALTDQTFNGADKVMVMGHTMLDGVIVDFEQDNLEKDADREIAHAIAKVNRDERLRVAQEAQTQASQPIEE